MVFLNKFEFTDWSSVNQRFRSGEIVILRQRMMIVPLPHRLGLTLQSSKIHLLGHTIITSSKVLINLVK